MGLYFDETLHFYTAQVFLWLRDFRVIGKLRCLEANLMGLGHTVLAQVRPNLANLNVLVQLGTA